MLDWRPVPKIAPWTAWGEGAPAATVMLQIYRAMCSSLKPALVQPIELDLAKFKGMVPVEMSASTPFPPIGELPYLLTLGGYMFAWFQLRAGPGQSLPPAM